jgi:hypothetical protein
MHAEGKLEGRLPARQGGRGFVEVAVAYSRPEMMSLLVELGLPLTPHAAVLLGKGDWLREQHAAGTLENPIDYDGGLISFAITHDRPDMLADARHGLDPNERTHENTEDLFVGLSASSLRQTDKLDGGDALHMERIRRPSIPTAARRCTRHMGRNVGRW